MTFAVSDLMRPADRTSRILRSAQALSVCAGGWPTSVRSTSGHREGAGCAWPRCFVCGLGVEPDGRV